MPSLDYARDVVDLFQSNHTEFVLVVVQPGKKRDKAVVFYSTTNPTSKEMLGQMCHYIGSKVMKQPAKSRCKVKVEPIPQKRKKLTQENS